MTTIVFNLSAQGLKRLAPITASVGTIATQAKGDETVTWSGDAASVTFTVGNQADYGSDGSSKAGQLCFGSVDITYTPSGGGQTTPSIDADDIDIDYDETSGSISYTIINGVTGGSVSASVPDGSWLTPGTATSTAVPFTCSANNGTTERTVTVTLTYTYGENLTVTKNVEITQAGKFNDITDITELGSSYKVKGTVVATNSRGFVIGDGTGYVYTYLNSAPSQSIGDKVTISGTTGSYGHILQFTNSASIATSTTSNYDGTPAVTVVDATAIAAYNSDYQLSDYVQLEGTLSTSGSTTTYYNITVGTATARISYPTSAQTTALSALVGKTVRVKGYFAGFSSSTFTVMMESVEEFVAAPQTLTVSATNGSVEITGKTLDSDGKCQVSKNASVEATATPAEHYTFTSWTATGVTLADNTANPLTFTMPTNAVTLTANFTEDAKHTARFYVNGTQLGSDILVYEGDAITFPSDPASINGYAFVGWTETELSAAQATTPTDLTKAANMGNADKTFYAVFALRSPGASTLVTDELDRAFTGVTGTSYETWKDKKSNSSAVYAGASAGGNLSIQLRTTNSSSGIVTTTSGGKVTKVVVEWNSNTSADRTLDIYGKNTAYEAATNLYGSTNQGTKLGSLNYKVSNVTTTELNIDGDYEFIGIRSNNGALFLNKIEITWTVSTPDTYSDYCTTVPEDVIAVTVGASKFTSVYYSDKALVVPTGLTAYTFKVNNSNQLEISQTIAAGETVAKDQAVVLYGAAGGYKMNVTATNGTKDVNNVLRGFDVASTTTGGTVYYRLTTKNNDPSTIGFYWGAANGEAFTVSAHKAYVAVDNELTFGAGARMADIFGFDEATGISTIDHSSLTIDNSVYNLNGQRVDSPKKGLYIVNGKKVLVK